MTVGLKSWKVSRYQWEAVHDFRSARQLLSATVHEQRVVVRHHPMSTQQLAEAVCQLLTRNLTANEWYVLLGPEPCRRTRSNLR